jgi:hypothetical protein
MNHTHLTAIMSLLIALSIAAERLVEIVRGFIPALNTPRADAKWEGRRRAGLQLIAVGAGVLTAWLARGAIPTELVDVTSGWSVLALRLLASGGSGFWNAILTYFLKVKDIKAAEADARKKGLEESSGL